MRESLNRLDFSILVSKTQLKNNIEQLQDHFGPYVVLKSLRHQLGVYPLRFVDGLIDAELAADTIFDDICASDDKMERYENFVDQIFS